MTADHLTDEQLQQFAEAPDSLDPEQALHISACESCKSRTRNYSEIYAGLNVIEKPIFDFNLAELVLERLPSPKAKFPRAAILCVGIGTMLMVLIVIPFSTQLFMLLQGLSRIGLLIMAVPVLAVSLLQGLAYVNEYKQKLSELESNIRSMQP